MIRSILSLLLLLTCAGCSTVNTVEPADPVMQPDYVTVKQEITDSGLDDIVSVQKVVRSTVSGDLLKIQVELKNKTDSYHRFNYRFSWFDKDGMVVTQGASPWRTSQVEGQETVYISAVSPSPNAQDFRLELLDSLASSSKKGTSTNPRARTLNK